LKVQVNANARAVVRSIAKGSSFKGLLRQKKEFQNELIVVSHVTTARSRVAVVIQTKHSVTQPTSSQYHNDGHMQ